MPSKRRFLKAARMPMLIRHANSPMRLDSLKVPEIDVETFRQGLSYEFAAYAKNTRLIDFILSVSGSSRYQSESGRQIARAICQAVEMRLAPAVTKQEDGTICIVHPDTSGPILVDTAYSKSGRWIARLFARVVPQSQGS